MTTPQFWLSCPATGEQFGLYPGPSGNAAIREFCEEWGLRQSNHRIEACLVEDIAVGSALLLCANNGSEFVLQVRGQAQKYGSLAEVAVALMTFFERPLATQLEPQILGTKSVCRNWQPSDYDMVFLGESLKGLSAQLEEALWANCHSPTPRSLLEALAPNWKAGTIQISRTLPGLQHSATH